MYFSGTFLTLAFPLPSFTTTVTGVPLISTVYVPSTLDVTVIVEFSGYLESVASIVNSGLALLTLMVPSPELTLWFLSTVELTLTVYSPYAKSDTSILSVTVPDLITLPSFTISYVPPVAFSNSTLTVAVSPYVISSPVTLTLDWACKTVILPSPLF